MSGLHRRRAGASRPGYPFISALTPRFASDTLPDGGQRTGVGSSPPPFRRCACPSGSSSPLPPGVTPPGRKNSAPRQSGGIFPGLAVPAAAAPGRHPPAPGAPRGRARARNHSRSKRWCHEEDSCHASRLRLTLLQNRPQPAILPPPGPREDCPALPGQPTRGQGPQISCGRAPASAPRQRPKKFPPRRMSWRCKKV